jgi:hypothetical protein
MFLHSEGELSTLSPHRTLRFGSKPYNKKGADRRTLVWWRRTGTKPFTKQLATVRRWRRRWRITLTDRSAKPCAIYVTTAGQASRFGVTSQHSGKWERDRPGDHNNDLAHINLPTVQYRVARLVLKEEAPALEDTGASLWPQLNRHRMGRPRVGAGRAGSMS